MHTDFYIEGIDYRSKKGGKIAMGLLFLSIFFFWGGGPLLSAWGNFASWLYYPPFSLALKSSKYAAYARKSPSPIVPLKISLFYLFPPLAEQKYFPLDS